ncbi:hypothetical protein MOBT1_002145 [Malassezia obtusa]|uniref:Sec39 domain-containing protein n=1 Tax=Malassezia obtusa TaxID=76774 RepID=A0AAF0IWV5_9BASI|nr:hypothetical protein MOBT1_002145 [Malassezia obtusa]
MGDARSAGRDRTRSTDRRDALMDADTESERRALLAALPAPPGDVAERLEAVDDPWWAAAACVAAVRAAGDAWSAADTARVLAVAAARTAAFDAAVQDALEHGEHALEAFVAADDHAPRVLLRRKLWHMQWLLRIPLAGHGRAGDVAARAERPLLEHAHALCLAGNAVALRALLGAHVSVARALFHTLLELRLLPGTRMPVEDRESGAWIELAAKAMAPATAAALWVEHPAVVALLARRGHVAPPAAPPAPPAGLSEWYRGVIHELEAELGLVEHARALADAGVRLSLVPLRTVADELRFLGVLCETLAYGDRWSLAALHAADARTILASVVAQPQPVPETVRMLRDDVVPFLQRGTYADAGAFRHASARDAAVEIALLVLELRTERSLAIAAQVVLAWLDDPAARARLALAILAGCDEQDDGAYVVLHALAGDAPAAGAGADAAGAPLVSVLARSADASVRARYAQLSVADAAAVHAALGAAAACVALARTLLRHGVARPLRAYLALDEARTKALCAALVRAARGRDAALAALVDDLAPFVTRAGAPARPLPAAAPAWLLTQLLAAREFDAFRALAAHLAAHARVPLARDDAARLAVDAARAWCDQAPTCDPLAAPLQRAAECLASAPPTPAVEDAQRFLALLAQLARYALPSLRDARAPLTPREVREVRDPLALLARVLALHASAYRAPQIRSLARALGHAPDTPPAVAAVRVEAMLADAAAAAGDGAAARDLGERAARGARGLPRDAAHAAAHDAASRAPAALDARTRAALFGHALALAPPAELPRVLDAWRAAGAPGGAPPAPARTPPRTLARLLAPRAGMRRRARRRATRRAHARCSTRCPPARPARGLRRCSRRRRRRCATS